ncbi:MAG TPA: hypothetical protein VH933_07375 [Aestuariivirgaceae bacterium]|jgi:hypothetical protein
MRAIVIRPRIIATGDWARVVADRQKLVSVDGYRADMLSALPVFN